MWGGRLFGRLDTGIASSLSCASGCFRGQSWNGDQEELATDEHGRQDSCLRDVAFLTAEGNVLKIRCQAIDRELGVSASDFVGEEPNPAAAHKPMNQNGA